MVACSLSWIVICDMKIITTISIIAVLAAGLFAYFSQKSTQEYFGYFQAEKVLIEDLERYRNNQNADNSVESKSFGKFYRILSTDTHHNLYEFHLIFSDGAKYTFQVFRNSDGWALTYIENK